MKEEAERGVKKDSADYMLKSLMAGGISGCFAKTVTAPLDRVKILFQGFNPTYIIHSGKPLGVFYAVRHIFDSHGWPGLFQGHSVMLMRIFPSAAIRFMSYEQFKRILMPNAEDQSPFRHFIAGSMAGNMGVMATYPLEVVRSRMAYEVRVHHEQYSISRTVKQIYSDSSPHSSSSSSSIAAKGSMRGFYKGFGATMLGVIPYAGAAFTSYQYMKDLMLSEAISEKYQTSYRRKADGRPEVHVYYKLLIGGLAGMLGQTVAYPIDTVRHRMQLEGVARGIPSYRSTWQALGNIFRGEGLRALYIGLTINYWKTIPANAVAFVTYDFMKSILDISD